MSLDDALEQYDVCQNCIYVDECPHREKKIVAAFEKRRDTVPCNMDILKGETSNE
jgi:hypothetical protein